eukprot:1159878-Pelagomonas_calceolata.AAC.9
MSQDLSIGGQVRARAHTHAHTHTHTYTHTVTAAVPASEASSLHQLQSLLSLPAYRASPQGFRLQSPPVFTCYNCCCCSC